MISHENVVVLYRAILGRDPESQAVLNSIAAEFTSPEGLSERLLNSDEFRRRIAYGLLPGAASRWVCAEIRNGLRLWVDLSDLGVAAGVLRDDWEAAETNFILSILRPGDRFVDIGANVGWFTVLAAHAVGPQGQVNAFEARPDIAARLGESVSANGFDERCRVHPHALGAVAGTMRVAAIRSEHNPGHSFLVPRGLPEGAEEIGIVSVLPLDEVGLQGPLRLIKIDVEGAEGIVVSGAAELLRREQPIIVSEIFPRWLRNVSDMSPTDYLRLLQSLGYRAFRLTEVGIGAEIHHFVDDRVGTAEDYINIVALPAKEVGSFLNQAMDGRVALLERELMTVTAERAVERARAETAQEACVTLNSSLEAATAARFQAEMQCGAAETMVAAERERAETLRRNLMDAGVRAFQAEMSARAERAELLAQLEQLRGSASATQLDVEHLQAQLEAARHGAFEATAERDVMQSSTLWQATRPLRQVGARLSPRTKRHATRLARLAWWSATLQLPQRLRDRRSAQTALAANSVQSDAASEMVIAPVSLPSVPVPIHAPAVPPCLRGLDQPVAMVIDQIWPQPDRDGGSIETVNLTEALILFGYRVIFAALHPLPGTDGYRYAQQGRGAHCLGPEDAPSVQAFIEAHGEAVSLFVLMRYDAGGQFLELIRYNCPAAKIIFYTIDLHFLREEREARLTGDAQKATTARRTRDREQFLTLRSDATIVVSPAEQVILSAAVPGAHIVTLPLGRAMRTTAVPLFGTRRDIGFVGGFRHMPNVDAVRFFLSDIWPVVRAALPDSRFLIAGADLPSGVVDGSDDRVVASGFVADLEGWFDHLRLSVAPIRFGAGLKGKVVSSLAAGLPCVATSVATEGMAITAGTDILISDTAETLAAEIVRAYSDPTLWTALSAAGQVQAARLFSIDLFRRGLHEVIIGVGLPVITPPGA